MYNLDAVVLSFNNLKNPRIVVLFKDFFKEDKGQNNKYKSIGYFVTVPKFERVLCFGVKQENISNPDIFINAYKYNSISHNSNTSSL